LQSRAHPQGVNGPPEREKRCLIPARKRPSTNNRAPVSIMKPAAPLIRYQMRCRHRPYPATGK
jgi:hypothetical protein